MMITIDMPNGLVRRLLEVSGDTGRTTLDLINSGVEEYLGRYTGKQHEPEPEVPAYNDNDLPLGEWTGGTHYTPALQIVPDERPPEETLAAINKQSKKLHDMQCNEARRHQGLAYPRTCARCGLGKCKHGAV